MGGQPGKPKPLGNPPIRQEPQQPQPIEEPPRPLPVPPVERPPLPMEASNLTYIKMPRMPQRVRENANGHHIAKTYPQAVRTRERRQIDHLVKECAKQRLPNGAFTALKPRAANRSKNRFGKSGARVRVDCQPSEPAFVKLLISADLQSMRPAGSSRLLSSRSILVAAGR